MQDFCAHELTSIVIFKHRNRSASPQDGHSPGKPEKVCKFKSGQGKVGENRKTEGKCVLACTKFGQLVLRKIIEIVVTRCHILRLKCTTFDFGWGSAPDPAGGAYSTSPDPLTGFKEAYF